MPGKNLNLSLRLKAEDGTPIRIESVRLNGQLFLPDETESSSPEASMVIPLVINEIEGPSNEITPQDFGSDDYDTLEAYGGKSFYKTFWGQLTYEPVDSERCKVIFQGDSNVFNTEFVGCWLEPSRIHKCPKDYPNAGRNYFPNALATVYSRVIEVLDGKTLLVDFAYNGKNLNSPQTIRNQDGIFFFDNKLALQSWASSTKRKNTIKARAGNVYGVLGIPEIKAKENSTFNFFQIGEGVPPAIHCMMSDAFNGDPNGQGLVTPGSFSETFGNNGVFFRLPGRGRVDVDFQWQFIPPTYSQRVVQYGSPGGTFFNDSDPNSQQYGLKRVQNFDQFRIRNEMSTALGFVREGVSFSMPNQGYCIGGGKHDGKDVEEFCTYRFEGDWISKNPNNMKARRNGGLRIEWVGESKDNPGRFIEMESLKPSRFNDLKMRFLSNRGLEVDSDSFTWLHLASQEWTGGTSTGSELTSIIIENHRIGLSTNGDFWLVNGEGDLKGRSFTTDRINLFDKVPRVGDIISQNLNDHSSNGIIGKKSKRVFEVWGWVLVKGDTLKTGGKTFTITKTRRKWKTWNQYSEQYSNPEERLKRSDRRITYTEIEIDQELVGDVSSIKFEVVNSQLTPLLDGKFRSGCSALWSIGNEAPGHLMYTDYNVNLLMKDVQIHGLIRSTARSLFAETTQELSGNISQIPIGNFGSDCWKKGHILKLLDLESGISQDVELITSFNGDAGNLLIKPISLGHTFPAKSVVLALYSLCSEAVFDNVTFIEESGEPSYSQRIDYRPQGLRLRQILEKDDNHRVKISGGRISWYSNLENRFEPEVELSNHPHLVNPKSVVPVLLNPIIKDGQGAKFGFQRKESGTQEIFISIRVIARNGESINLQNSELGSDLTLEGNGEFKLDNLKTLNYVENGQAKDFGFNLRFQDKFTKSKNLSASGSGGKVGIMIDTNYPIGDFKLSLSQWELYPGIFNANGFQSKQNRKDPKYSQYVQINEG